MFGSRSFEGGFDCSRGIVMRVMFLDWKWAWFKSECSIDERMIMVLRSRESMKEKDFSLKNPERYTPGETREKLSGGMMNFDLDIL
jgi:hypothetical protein